MRKTFLRINLLAALLLGQATLRAQNVEPYFTTEEMPDLIQCLPAPPDSLSAAYTYDIMRYLWGKTQRQDPERAAMVRRDAVWTYEALIAEFCGPFGMVISKEATPEIWKVLETSLATVDQIRIAPKAYFHRKRPFEVFGEKTFTGEDEELSGEGSYPSGHTILGWSAALLLSEVNPDSADAIMAVGYRFGQSRVIAGFHWQSDVDAGRLVASAAVARLHADELFLKLMAEARKEARRLFLH
jgi:acid phosphatase (class A)